MNKVDVSHWTGEKKIIKGDVVIDGIAYRFLGKGSNLIKQTKRIITPLISEYHFENEMVHLKVSFWSPAFLDDPVRLSRPTSYIDFEIDELDDKHHDISIQMSFDESFAYNLKKDGDINGSRISTNGCNIAFLGKKKQPLLEASGDYLRINWGYLFIGVLENDGEASYVQGKRHALVARINSKKATLIVSYDDIASLNYYGHITYGYWKKRYKDIVEAIIASFADHDECLEKARQLDKKIIKDAKKSGGSPLVTIVTASYRQSIAGHKTSYDENGDLIFISKENSSNGCAATVDISYPSMPLYILFNPEFVFGMIRPIIKCARLLIWKYDFSPHDGGRYPHLYGNVYGIDIKDPINYVWDNNSFLPFYLFSGNEKIFMDKYQMPVEECGNMLIMIAAASLKTNDLKIARKNMDLLRKWAKYLVDFGQDPNNQICTDDFAGHLAHNANLAAKSILGIEAFAQINKMLGNEEGYEEYHSLAKQFAADWEKKAIKDDHTILVFDDRDGWSLKYNLIWDDYFKSNLFSRKMKENEVDWYIKKINKFGTPLDCRADYTKTDWLTWVSCLTSDLDKRVKFLKPIEKFINTSKERTPFADLYDTKTGKRINFKARSVVGGCFIPMLFDLNK